LKSPWDGGRCVPGCKRIDRPRVTGVIRQPRPQRPQFLLQSEINGASKTQSSPFVGESGKFCGEMKFSRKTRTSSCTLRMTFFVKWCRFQLAIEVWIYFSFLEFWPGAEIGTQSQPLESRSSPQHIVVFFTNLSPKFGPLGKAKGLLDKFSHPAKIQ
jgi:hypothetical protein